ncbi:dihydrofolate reductase family protein [Nonomuraea sp. NPDC002799]
MGSIKSGLFVSLDGVTEAPDTWHFGYFNDEMGGAVGALMGGNDAMLLGRRTYDEFAGYWPNADADDPMTKQMNGTQKYVVSNTLTQATWENTTVLGGADVYDRLRALKAEQNLGITGSGTLVRSLLAEGLIDELHLLVHPVVLGTGQRVFEGSAKVPLKLVGSTTFSTGVLHLIYTNE